MVEQAEPNGGTVSSPQDETVEDLAVRFVMDFERRQGRLPVDTRRTGAPADIESAPRFIEVKAFGPSARGEVLWLEPRQLEEARSNPDFYVYVVDNVRQRRPGGFGLCILGGEVLSGLIQQARQRHYFEVPFPVRVYDDCADFTASG